MMKPAALWSGRRKGRRAIKTDPNISGFFTLQLITRLRAVNNFYPCLTILKSLARRSGGAGGVSERGNSLLRFLDRWLGIPFCLATSLLRKLGRHAKPEEPARAALLCLGAIGDLLLLNFLIQALAARFPRLKIDLLLSRANAQAGELLPNINAIKTFSITRPDKIISYLRAQKYDLLIDSGQWARISAIICNCSGAGCSAGFKSAGQWRHFGYDFIAPHSSGVHEKDNFMALGRALWPDLKESFALRIPERNDLNILPRKGKWICLHMRPSGVKSRLKEWPEENWRELCKQLLSMGFILLLTGSEADRAAAESFIKRYFINNKNIISLAGRLKLAETALVIKKARALISVNTGIMHLGALSGTPVIGLHGPTNPDRWGPLGPNSAALLPKEGMRAYLDLGFEYPKNAASSMPGISVAEVLQGLRRLGVNLEQNG